MREGGRGRREGKKGRERERGKGREDGEREGGKEREGGRRERRREGKDGGRGRREGRKKRQLNTDCDRRVQYSSYRIVCTLHGLLYDSLVKPRFHLLYGEIMFS